MSHYAGRWGQAGASERCQCYQGKLHPNSCKGSGRILVSLFTMLWLHNFLTVQAEGDRLKHLIDAYANTEVHIREVVEQNVDSFEAVVEHHFKAT